MATKLTKTVCRETTRLVATKKGRLCSDAEGGRPIIASLNPDETISFRVKGTKTRITVHIMSCYALAQIMTYESNYKEKLKLYNNRRKSGLRCRKPKRYQLPYNKLLFKAI